MNSINHFVDKISNISYRGNLKISRIVRSVNCKEWEKEKECHSLSCTISPSMASRCYVTQNSNAQHVHEGHIDFRPRDSKEELTVSDAFLPIPDEERFYATCKKAYRSDNPFCPIIETVPYTTPDNVNFLCSPSTLWIMLRILSVDFGKEYISLGDINSNLPSSSRGNSVGIKEYIPFFSKYGYEPVFYSGNKQIDFFKDCKNKIDECKDHTCDLKLFYELVRGKEDDFNDPVMNSEILYSYIESGIPVYMVFEATNLIEELKLKGQTTDSYHAVVAIGHTLDANSNCTHYIIHDVSIAPFVKISKEFIDQNLLEALVLLPNVIKVRPEKIEEKFNEIYKAYLQSNNLLSDLCKTNIKKRSFFSRSQDVKFWFTNPYLYDEKTISIFANADFPVYIWVIEIKTNNIKDANQCTGHIVFDATLSKGGVILINLPGFRLWFENKERKTEYPKIDAFGSVPIFKAPHKVDSTKNT